MIPAQVPKSLECLRTLGRKPALFVGSIDVQATVLFFTGFCGAVRIAYDLETTEIWKQVVQERGWQPPKATGPGLNHEMVQKGLSASEAIEELVNIEIEVIQRALFHK